MRHWSLRSSLASAYPDEALVVRRLAWWGLTLGVILTILLVARQGRRDVATAVARVGGGILTILLIHLVKLVARGVGWRSVLTGERRPAIRTFVRGRWLADSINDLLPVMEVGGHVVRARAAADAGIPPATAGASVVVDLTVIMATHIPVALMGICLLVIYCDAGAVVARAVPGAAVSIAMLCVFIVAQRGGLFGAARLFERLVRSPKEFAMGSSLVRLDTEVRRLYRNRRALLAGGGWHLAGWLLAATETWVTLYYLGHPVRPSTAIIWQSLAEVIRISAFVVVGALGVQEGAYVVLGGVFGVPPDAALALSLVGRVRELIFGVPGIVAWRVRTPAAHIPAT